MSAPAAARPASGRRALVAIVSGVVVLLAALVAVSALRPPERPLDPTSASKTGARALARVLAESKGATVEPVRDAAALRGATIDGTTTIVVADTANLSASAADDLARRAGDAGRLVLLDPPDATLRRLRVPVAAANPRGDTRPPAQQGEPGAPATGLTGSCTSVGADPTPASPEAADVGDAERVAQGRLYRPDPARAGGEAPLTTATTADVCLRPDPADGGAAAPGETPRGAYVLVPARGTSPEIVVLGLGEQLANATVPTGGDDATAAIALRTLGHAPRVLWYLPSPADGLAPGASAPATWPPAFLGSVIVALAALALACVWRGRRFGRLVVEPLPAVVPAVETVRARARLYARSGDATHALGVLRAGTLDRLRRRLRLPPGTDAAGVADRVAELTGAPPPTVRAVLAPTGEQAATTARDLPARATDLRRLEREADQA